jgi:uncharacterized cofD-like protein
MLPIPLSTTAVVGPRVSEEARSPLSIDQLRVVALGGGTGLPVVLEGLKHALFAERAGCPARSHDQLTAIVTVADDGGSSGRLRQAYGVLPPGDIRNCLLALADRSSTLAALFDYRFDESGDEIGGHSLGNLILTALSRMENDFSRAIQRGGEILGVQGRVFPSTTEAVQLRAQFEDGSWVEGESRIPSVPGLIRRVLLQPEAPAALAQAVEAVLYADVVVIGPGSLYTSLIPVLLVKELTEAIRQSQARVVLVMNLTTEPGETDRYTAADHLLAVRRHAPDVPIHDVLLNTTPVPGALMQAYSAAGATPVCPDIELLRALGYRPVRHELLGAGPKIRHDPHKLAAAILGLAARAGAQSGGR